MNTDRVKADSTSPNFKVIRFLKLHDDTVDQAKFRIEYNAEHSKEYYYEIQAKRRPGVVLRFNGRYSLVWSLTSCPTKNACPLKITGLSGSSFLRWKDWEIIWVPDNLVVGNVGNLGRDQTKIVLDEWRKLHGYGPPASSKYS